MRIGIVDLGTLSLRFDVYDVRDSNPPLLVHRARSMPRLGDELFHDGQIDQSAIERTVHELGKIRDDAETHGVQKLVCVGTSALRDAKNCAALLEAVKQATGIEIRVLSGDDEARLTALGIFANEQSIGEHTAFIDVGGGSSEISFIRSRQIVDSISLDLGALRIQKRFLSSRDEVNGLFSPQKIAEARRFIDIELSALEKFKSHFPLPQVVGSSGTIRTLERLHLAHPRDSRVIARKAVDEFALTLERLSRTQILALPGMDENRADVIFPGVLILQAILRTLGAESILVTFFSLRHGVLEEELERLKLSR